MQTNNSAIAPQPIELTGPTEDKINILLSAIKPKCEVSGVDAIYIIQALQLALSHPTMSGWADDVATKRVRAFAMALTNGVARHSALRKMLDESWRGVDLCQAANREIALKKAAELSNK